MEESRHITLSTGNVSLSPELGVYYIDMRPSRIHYQGKKNIWGGHFDDHGIPLISTQGKLQYYPINLAQYGFILHADWLENKDDRILQTMKNLFRKLEELKVEGEQYCVWYHREPHNKYHLEPPWVSAMAQGEVISFYLRMYQVTGNESLLNSAKKACAFLKVPVSEGGVRCFFESGEPWLEEYPSSPPSYVLNGFIYALFGMFDLYRITEDGALKADIDQLINTLKEKLPLFSTWYWSLYDLRRKELVRYYYQKNVHVPQMKILFELTGEPVFKKYEEKWRSQANWLNFQFVKIMYRIRPRWQKLTGH